MFDPEKVIPADTNFPDENGKWYQASCVEASDYDALLALYRKAIQNIATLTNQLDELFLP